MSVRHFLADLKIASVGKKLHFWHPTAQAASSCLFPDTFWLQVLKNAFKAGTVNFANSLSRHHLPLWRKYTLEVKTAKGLKRCQVKAKGVNNPAWTATDKKEIPKISTKVIIHGINDSTNHYWLSEIVIWLSLKSIWNTWNGNIANTPFFLKLLHVLAWMYFLRSKDRITDKQQISSESFKHKNNGHSMQNCCCSFCCCCCRC